MAEGILLLGGSGFVGGALAARLIEAGHPVHILSRHETLPSIAGAHWHGGSLDNREKLDALLPECGTIIHLASTCTPGTSARTPAREGEENLLPLLRLLEILSHHQPRPLLFLSSGGTVYGNPVVLPVVEDAPFAAQSYHGAAKAAAELFLTVFAHEGWPVTVQRPSNLNGPGQALKVGFGAVRTVLEHLKRGSTMEVWGNGETVRDYLYIDDLIQSILLVLQQGVTGTFNVGRSEGISINHLITLAEATSGQQLNISRQPARSVDVRSIVLDNHKLQIATGWTPSVTLNEGLTRTWQWLIEQP